jgi:hypothetical protein
MGDCAIRPQELLPGQGQSTDAKADSSGLRCARHRNDKKQEVSDHGGSADRPENQSSNRKGRGGKAAEDAKEKWAPSGEKILPSVTFPDEQQIPPCSLRSRVGMTRLQESVTIGGAEEFPQTARVFSRERYAADQL